MDMRPKMSATALLIIYLFLSSTSTVCAQDEEGYTQPPDGQGLSIEEPSFVYEEEPADQPKSVTTSNPHIPVEHLQLKVKPLTKAELATEAEAWRNLLQEKVHEISQLQIQSTHAGSTADPTTADNKDATDIPKKISKLQDERTGLIDRLNVVLNDYENKGGDVEEYQKYAAAVNGIDLNIHDASKAGTVIWEWMFSEKGGQRWMWNILKFLAILIVFYILSLIAGRITERLAGRIKGASVLLKKFLASFARQTVMIVGFIMSLAALEVNISPLLAAIGGAAFVIGLALQGTLSNFASGLLILGYRPFDVGDVIEAAGITGIVDSMNLISTKIRTFDNKVIIVPNNKISTDTITNATASTTRRVDMTFGIGYDDDIAKAKEILESIVKQQELVLHDPAPVIQLNELADSSVNFIVRPWAKTADYWTVFWSVTRQVKEEFDRNGISIPFPQRDVHIYQEKLLNTEGPNAEAT